ncbi:MAG: hypothetical protein Q9211_002805 [Gyalolechia sp. 1 TL-2023]
MGYGLPAAIGAKVARPDALVIDIDGDASFSMTLTELSTMAQFNIGAKVIILNNNPDFVKLSEAMKIQARRCIAPNDVEAKLRWLIESEGPALLEVKVDQKVPVLPMVAAGKALHEMQIYDKASRPALVHSTSKQSVTASDDFYSLSSGESGREETSTVHQYQAPPLHTIPGPYRKEEDVTTAAKPTIRTIVRTPPTAQDTARPDESNQGVKIKRKPLSTESSPTYSNNEVISPPTPGVDDTPYIQFAIEQLTRDEEVQQELTSRGHGAPTHHSYPVDRIVPDERLRSQQESSSGGRGERSLQPLRRPSGSSSGCRRTSLSRSLLIRPPANAIPATPAQDSFRFPTLSYLPRPLRLLPLTTLILCCVLMMAAVAVSTVWSSRHQGIWRYDDAGTSRYFVFQYLPQLLAVIIVIWLFVIVNSLYRILPFSMMHSERRAFTSDILHTAALFPSNYMIPHSWCFQHGEMIVGFCLNIFWLCLFTVPLQACLFQTRYFAADDERVWRWTVVQPIGWILFVFYLLLALALALLVFRLRRDSSGLRWDPRSLADILVLFQRSNVLSDLYGSEVRPGRSHTTLLKKYTLRYWIAGKRSSEIFHGVEESQAPLRGFRHQRGPNEKQATASDQHNPLFDLESQRPLKASTLDSLQKDVHNSRIRFRWLPWFLKDSFVVAWIVMALVLMLAFVIVSFVNDAVRRGFMPLLPSPTNSQGFSPSNFLYSFVPGFIGMVLFLLWQPIDMYFRALEPFAHLGGSTRGSPAEQSLLLDYTACLPVEITIKAALAGHYKVAWISFISLLSATLPVLGGGVFTAQYFIPTQEVRMAASMPGYYALAVFVVIYSLSFLVIWPRQKRRLPHDIRTLGQILSFVYESHLLHDSAFWQPRSKVDLVTRLLGSLTGDQGSSKYAFGVYMGRDGREHLGIDRLHRPESGEMFITTGTMES